LTTANKRYEELYLEQSERVGKLRKLQQIEDGTRRYTTQFRALVREAQETRLFSKNFFKFLFGVRNSSLKQALTRLSLIESNVTSIDQNAEFVKKITLLLYVFTGILKGGLSEEA
jgi:hypothetical protein